MPVNPMTTLLTDIGLFFTQILAWAGDVADFITTNPLTLLGVGMVVIGFAVGLLSRMISARA